MTSSQHEPVLLMNSVLHMRGQERLDTSLTASIPRPWFCDALPIIRFDSLLSDYVEVPFRRKSRFLEAEEDCLSWHRGVSLTQAFSYSEVWSNDVFVRKHEDIANIDMVGGHVHALQLQLSCIRLHQCLHYRAVEPSQTDTHMDPRFTRDESKCKFAVAWMFDQDTLFECSRCFIVWI